MGVIHEHIRERAAAIADVKRALSLPHNYRNSTTHDGFSWSPSGFDLLYRDYSDQSEDWTECVGFHELLDPDCLSGLEQKLQKRRDEAMRLSAQRAQCVLDDQKARERAEYQRLKLKYEGETK